MLQHSFVSPLEADVTADIPAHLNASALICFAAGTEIITTKGRLPVQDLKRDDSVLTQDHGFQRLRWIGRTSVVAQGNFAPIKICKGALGNDRDLWVSPQHRMLIADWRAEMMFGQSEVLIAATHLVNGDTIYEDAGGVVEYCHILFDQHEIVFAESIPSESFHPGEIGMKGLGQAQRHEIYSLFPELRQDIASYGPSARSTIGSNETPVLQFAAE